MKTSKGYEAGCGAPCEDKMRLLREQEASSSPGFSKPLGSPGRDFALGLPAALIFFLAHIAGVVMSEGRRPSCPDVWADDERLSVPTWIFPGLHVSSDPSVPTSRTILICTSWHLFLSSVMCVWWVP
ncbi:hypothetical protein mRhiFer1_008516 [Rhinolophus ferrumequinum]|uniref:Uncharacterized protein n=1 Tax=Rhinolophus ferrumequinum TaxID=59479 RepID=A0A7J7UX68_RHIFE|nr:hypothetical protein mRhiFer1_008516 [Rhinolophus ferrumequinum]